MNRLLVIGLVLIASPVTAQESLRIPTVVYFSAASSDWASTAYCLHHPLCHEGNPTLRWAERPLGTAGVIAVSAALDVAIVYAVHRWLAPSHPKIASALLYIGAADRVVATVQNIRNRRALTIQSSGGGPTCVTRQSGPFQFCE